MGAKKILLVDDANTVLVMERMMLQRCDYDVVVARNGEEAVAQALAERPDLILLDVVMPRMDGFEACRRIRAHEELRSVPIIMVTTRSEAGNVQQGFDSGCSDYVTKPFNGPQLLAKLQAHLAK